MIFLFNFQNCLYNWSETIRSDLCWVIVDKKLCVATHAWWDLHISDRKLLITIILSSCYDQNTSADIPIFLPHSSTKVNYTKTVSRIINLRRYFNNNINIQFAKRY